MSLLIKRNGNRLFSPFKSRMSDFFEDDFFEGELFSKSSFPAVNVKESDEQFDLELAAPGLSKEDFSINVANGVLTISGENETSNEEEKEGYTRKEFSYAQFNRSFTLPENVNVDEIDAEYNKGLLRVSLRKNPKLTTEKKTEIKVK